MCLYVFIKFSGHINCCISCTSRVVDSSTGQVGDNVQSMDTNQETPSGQFSDLPDLGPDATEGMPDLDSAAGPAQSSVVISIPTSTTIEDNAVAAQKILDDYNKMTAPPPKKKDMNYSFPPGLFTTEVDLEGSELAFRNLLEGLETDQDLQDLLNKIDADPFKQSDIFSDLDFDIFD